MKTGQEFVENFLEHHGVKGMKWGVRKSEYKAMSGSERKTLRKKARASMRSADRQTRLNDKVKRSEEKINRVREIENARNRLRSGQVHNEWSDAKIAFQTDKYTIGKIQAKRNRQEAFDKFNSEIAKSKEAKNGYEVAMKMVAEYAAQSVIDSIRKR